MSHVWVIILSFKSQTTPVPGGRALGCAFILSAYNLIIWVFVITFLNNSAGIFTKMMI